MVKQGARDERAIDGRHKSQRAYTCPFPFCCEPESDDAITENDGSNETIQQGRDACGPEWKMQFGQKEKAQTHDQVDNSCQQCEYALCRAKSEMIHGSLLPCSSSKNWGLAARAGASPLTSIGFWERRVRKEEQAVVIC